MHQLTSKTHEDVNDFLVTGSATAAVNSLELSSALIADKEIKIWKTRTIPFPKDKNPLDECGASFPLVWCVGEACTCYFCNFSSSRALVFHGGYREDKKHSSLTCDNMKELVYLHEVWPRVRD